MDITLTSRARAALSIGLVAVALAACGGDPAPLSAPADAASESTAAPATTAAPTTTPTTTVASAGSVDAAVKISQTEIGDVLADPSGKTVYAFTNDVEAISTCYGTCADAWPPVIVDADFLVSPGLDSGIFATTERDDGQLQLVAGKYPLYSYAADAKPGDLTGHGVGDVWFAVDLDGRLAAGTVEVGRDGTAVDTDSGTQVDVDADGDVAVDDAGGDEIGVDVETDDPYSDADANDDAENDDAENDDAENDDPATATPSFATSDSDFGTILTDDAGLTLYIFTEDEAGEPTCADG